MSTAEPGRLPAVIMMALLALPALPATPARAAVGDSDGDGMADEQDALPGIADFPLLGRLESLTFRWLPESAPPADAAAAPAWAEARSLVLFSREELASAPAPRAAGAARTAGPGDPSAAGTTARDVDIFLGRFGTGEVAWRTVQRVRAARLAAGAEGEGAGRAARLEFEISFRNLGERDCRLGDLRVPVTVAGRRDAEARPADAATRAGGVILPGGAGAAPARVAFHAVYPPRRVGRLLAGLRQEAPRLEFERARGELAELAGETPIDLTARLAAIMKSTVALEVRGAGETPLTWRVARRTDGRRQTVGDWAVAVDRHCRRLMGRAFWGEDAGFPVSLAGWDNGAWDRWWELRQAGRDPGDSFDWRFLPLDRDTFLELRDSPPALAEATRRRLEEQCSDPVAACLAGRLAWLGGDYARAAAFYRRAADSGYAPGQTLLGQCCLEGRGVAGDAAAAARLFRMAAAQNYAPAAVQLGHCHKRGLGVTNDRAAMAAAYGRAAAQGHPEGLALHAVCLARGAGLPAEPARAREILRAAAARDGADAQYALGRLLLEEGASEALDWLRCAAEQGEIKAAALLGECLMEGRGGPRDPAEAKRRLQQAAAAGDAAAQLALARILLAGHGGRRDGREALRWLERAAAQGNAEAQVRLGLMLIEGRGAKRDPEAGLGWARQAAENGHPQGQFLLGLCHFAGLGTARDESEAFRWFGQAAEHGVPPAQVFVGFCHLHGKGVQPDAAEAARWFRRAAEQGAAIGQVWLAWCLAEGRGVERDLAQAREWAQRAADQGHPAGRLLLTKLPRR